MVSLIVRRNGEWAVGECVAWSMDDRRKTFSKLQSELISAIGLNYVGSQRGGPGSSNDGRT